jgi:hypothetical protein
MLAWRPDCLHCSAVVAVRRPYARNAFDADITRRAVLFTRHLVAAARQHHPPRIPHAARAASEHGRLIVGADVDAAPPSPAVRVLSRRFAAKCVPRHSANRLTSE